MIFRLAEEKDLKEIKKIFKEIVEDMKQNNLNVWNEYYPIECFKEDIQNSRLYLLEKDNEIVAVSALVSKTEGSDIFKWNNISNNCIYIARLGVNRKYKKQGYGSELLNNIKTLCKKKKISYIRLFVVDTNKAAIDFYNKNGFLLQEGIFAEKIDENCTLLQYGMEYKI